MANAKKIKRTRFLVVRLSGQEKSILQQAAAVIQWPVSSFTRVAAIGAARLTIRDKRIPALAGEVERGGLADVAMGTAQEVARETTTRLLVMLMANLILAAEARGGTLDLDFLKQQKAEIQ